MKKNNRILLVLSVICLCVIGIVMIYSSSYIWASYKYNDSLKYVKSQFIFLLMGIISIFFIKKMNLSVLYKNANAIMIISLLLLVLVLIPGIGVVRNGSQSWIKLGPIGLQPSEFAKVGLIIYVSKYLANNHKNIKSFKQGVFPVLLVVLIFFGLIMLEPDFGTAMVMVVTLLCIIFISGVKVGFFLKTGLFGLIGIVILIIIAPYRLKRIISFLNPWSDPLGSGYQIIQSLYAIGPGGILGQGFLNSRQKNFYLPEPQTDFIFSIISEEFGFLGIVIISILFIIFFYNSLKVAMSKNDNFEKYLSFGLAFGIIFQCLLNLMVVVGLLPVTGVTLPFLSYGGSSLLVSLISVGIILNMSNKKDL